MVVGVAVARVALARPLESLDVGEKLLANHLDGLAAQRKLPTLGFALQVVAVRPTGPLCSRGLVTANAVHPDARGFQLRGSQASSRPLVEILESMDMYSLHGRSCHSAEPA
jgi:hypothetical protein